MTQPVAVLLPLGFFFQFNYCFQDKWANNLKKKKKIIFSSSLAYLPILQNYYDYSAHF